MIFVKIELYFYKFNNFNSSKHKNSYFSTKKRCLFYELHKGQDHKANYSQKKGDKMEHDFWHQAWEERRLGFHRTEIHPQLMDGVKKLNLPHEAKTLVPLCGKTLDMLWLLEQEHLVTGVELSPKAIHEFIEENKLTPEKKSENHFKLPCLDLIIGDFLAFNSPTPFDFIYDRAALVALPPDMRVPYAKHCIKQLKSGGKLLLVSFEYDQTKVQGPPHSVEKTEIQEIYQGMNIEIFHEKSETPKAPKFQDNNVSIFKQVSYLMTKI